MKGSCLFKFFCDESKSFVDALVVPVVVGGEGVRIVSSIVFDDSVKRLLFNISFEVGGVVPSVGGCFNGVECHMVVFVCIGKDGEVSKKQLIKSYSSVSSFFKEKHCIKDVGIIMPEQSLPLEKEEIFECICEGLHSGCYHFSKKSEEKIEEKLKNVTFFNVCDGAKEVLTNQEKIFKGVNLAKDLVNGNADEVTPEMLANVALDLEKYSDKISVEVFDKEGIEKHGMGLLLAVARGGFVDPRFIVVKYKGNVASEDCTVLVGKGITFDSGGLNLKSSGNIEAMRTDMGGAATVLGTMKVLAKLNMGVNVVGVIPSTENAIGNNSYKPGDVYTSYCGKTVEITNTDAEGRLILADALSYAVKNFNPSRVVDFATLTGAMVVALGECVSGIMSNDDELYQQIFDSGIRTFERVWRFPLFEEYRELMKSQTADIKNCSANRKASSITAAIFLQEFVGDVSWAHIDIAGTAYLDKYSECNGGNATGVGVKLMIDFLKNFEKDSG